ncbi:AMP-dependent synthetase and ligase [Beutenbergia cavernae DSM 12333]|uniref:Acyl-CoA synthetase n=1 Tax=Beutenbergia cavernae (strain ATCC BAA-8 / DSM 12333 / CCUG 43141 / JCM 11478 / NBRC 16432 / NCIMB 13614 / HKI 0122) TaxID=471853 RepID=C5C5G6_BEUC1|nr:AMP-dependent synthetase/ligase [Beutenbergia cavernae]ACQ80157.1 AMP-dependent synthetase and ligase [Beutenbergia cavernae DSM 12333]
MDSSASPLAVEIDPRTSISDLLVEHARATPSRVLLEQQVDGQWRPYTAAEVEALVVGVAKGLVAHGIRPGERVAIMSRTRFEWTILDFAIWHAGAVPVPVYETSSVAQTAWILSDSGAVAVIVESSAHGQVVAEAQAEAPDVRTVWTIDDGALEDLTRDGADVDDAEIAARHDAVGMEDLATIIYTSGTTGRPRGAELTHGNFVALTKNAIAVIPDVFAAPGARTLLFMPLAHVFARFVEVLVVAAGVPLGHTPDTTTLVADLGTFRPTFILSVPRVFEKVYNSAEAKAAAGGKEKIFAWAARTAIAYSRSLDTGGPSYGLRLKHRIAHKLVLHKLQDAMGGKLEHAVSGGGPLGERLGHFFRGIGLVVLEGYGLTETTAPLNVNRPERVKIGTVGPPLPGIGIRIAPDGEILAQGIAVFRGYHDNDAATAEAMKDGWFHTGDIGELDSDGYLRITGRKKEIIVTAGGKNVAPAPLEDAIRAHPLVSQCLVVGDGRPFVAALITLDPEMLPTWLSSRGKPELTVAQARTDEDVLAAIDEAVNRANTHVSRAESIRKVVVLEDDFTIANDYLTPSLKVKRSAVVRDRAAVIDELYAAAATERDRRPA